MITPCPGVPGACWLAYHEISLAVTSCGCPPPVSVQIVRGCTGSATSASTFLIEPCITSTASRALGAPVQVACIAAQGGTGMGLGATADGLAEGEGLGEGLGVGLATSDDNGLGFTAVPAEPQPV